MKLERFEEIVEAGEVRRKALRLKKSSDYDQIDLDRLSSFKKVATICNTLGVDNFTSHTPSGIATMLLILKQVRDANLKNSGRLPQNESRADTFDDTHVYVDLKHGCEIDEQEETYGNSNTQS